MAKKLEPPIDPDCSWVKRAILYLRVSTDEQADKGYSLPTQLEACERYAHDHSFEIVGIYTDDYTGAVPLETRPEGRKAYDMLRSGAADVLIAYRIDRIVRPPEDGDEWDMPVLIRGLAKLGRDIHTVNRGQLRTDFASLLIAMLDAKGAGDERRAIIERTGRGRLQKAKTGQVVGMGIPPYGYKYAKSSADATKTTMLEIDETQAHVVRLIYDWYTVGHNGRPIGTTLIARELIKMRIPTPSEASGYMRKKEANGIWCTAAVSWILKSETYKGLWRFGKSIGRGGKGGKRDKADTIAVDVPAIVSKATWQAAQDRCRDNTTMLRAPGKRYYLLTGLMMCGCGYVYHGSNGRYVCSMTSNMHRHYRDERCNEKSIKADVLEAAVWADIESIITNPDQLEARLRAARDEGYDILKPKHDELATVEALIQETEAQAATVATALGVVRKNKLVAAQLQKQAQEIDDRYATLTKRRVKLLDEIDQGTISDNEIASLSRFGADARTGLENPTPQQQRHWLELLKVRLVIKGGVVKMMYSIGKDGLSRVIRLQQV